MSKAPGIKDILRDVDERLGAETLDSIVTQPIVKPTEPLFTAPKAVVTPPPQQPVYSLF
jgi:hypothetical protein